MKKILMLALAALPVMAHAQDDLVKKLDANKSDDASKKYHFTKLIDLEHTSVKNQASSGTCWPAAPAAEAAVGLAAPTVPALPRGSPPRASS